MGWTAGADVSTGDLITAAQWNNYLGATGSLEYLKTETDKLDDVTHSEPSRALGTIYQNTSGKLRFVTVQIYADQSGSVKAEIGSASPPTIVVGQIGEDSIDADIIYAAISFIVPLAWYYRIVTLLGSPTLQDWHEWDLH